MSLEHVLSAMRHIIMDQPEIPLDPESRLKVYKRAFPQLSAHELEDLAKIDPKRFEVYSTSIFSGERNVLQNHFPMTFEVLRTNWKSAFAEEFNGFRLVQTLHHKRPWKSRHVQMLAQNFVDFIRNDLREIHSVAPYIDDLARLEALTLGIKRQVCMRYSPKSSLRPEQLTERTVAAALELTFALPPCARVVKFDYDAPATFIHFHTQGRTLPKSIEKVETCAIGSRTRDNLPRWLSITPCIFDYFERLQPMQPHAIADLAEVIVSEFDASTTEEQAFMKFLEQLSTLMECGAVVVQESDGQQPS